MFAIEVQRIFTASHQLRLPGGGVEPRHSHDWQVTARISCTQLDALETVLDFHQVERALDAILIPWKNQNLNDFEPFRTQVNPSAERIAEHIALALRAALIEGPAPSQFPRLRLDELRITEAPNCLAIWFPS